MVIKPRFGLRAFFSQNAAIKMLSIVSLAMVSASLFILFSLETMDEDLLVPFFCAVICYLILEMAATFEEQKRVKKFLRRMVKGY